MRARVELPTFHRFVCAVYAEHSTRVRLLRASRARRLRELLSQRRAAERRWEGEGGRTRSNFS